MRNLFSGTLGTLLLFGLAGLGGYFGNVELQSYWGRQAVQNTGLKVHRLDEAIVKAKSEDKLVFVDVSAIWCGTCRRLDNDVFSNEDVKQALDEGYVFSRIEYETEEGQKFLQDRNVKGFPNLWILDGEGNDVRRVSVTFDPAKFVEQLR